MNRRTFLGALSVPAILSLTGSASAQSLSEPDGYRAIPTWFGPADARPDPSELQNRSGEVLYLSSDGGLSHLVLGDSAWTDLPKTLAGFEPADLPTDLPNGALVFDEFRNLPAWWDRDHYEYPNFVDDVKTAPVTVANTATRTTVFDPDINENSLVQGRKYQIQLSGSFGTANTSDTFAVDVNLAGATDLAGIGNAPANVSNAPWWAQFEFSVRQAGQNGVLAPTTMGIFNSEAQQAPQAHTPVSVDTTSVTELSVDIQWDAADPDNTVTVDQAHLVQMG